MLCFFCVCSCMHGLRSRVQRVSLNVIPMANYPLSYYPWFGLVWTHVPHVFESKICLCSWMLSSECMSVIRTRFSTFQVLYSITIPNHRILSPPPDSTVNWDSHDKEESGLAPVSQKPITMRRAKSQQSLSPNFVPCTTPGGRRHITQGIHTRSTNIFHRTTARRRKRET